MANGNGSMRNVGVVAGVILTVVTLAVMVIGIDHQVQARIDKRVQIERAERLAAEERAEQWRREVRTEMREMRQEILTEIRGLRDREGP